MKKLIRPVFVLVCVLLLTSASIGRPVRASDYSDTEFVKFLEDAWVHAIIDRNADVLDRVLAEDFIGLSPNGERYTKKEAIADVKSGFYAVEKMDLDKVEVRIFGDTAVVTYYQNEKSKFGEEDSSGRYAFTDVWVRRGDDWMAVSSHGTPLNLP